MKFHRLILCVGVFASGFATSWLVRPTAGKTAPFPTVPGREYASSPARAAKELSKARVEELLESIGDVGYGGPQTLAALAQVKVEEFPLLIGALIRKAGYRGLRYQDRAMVEGLVAAWYDRDPDAALAWVQGYENAQSREGLLGAIIGKVLKKNPREGVALLMRNGQTEEGRWVIPDELSNAVAHLSAEEIVSFLGKMVHARDFPYSMGSVDWPDHFDFRKVLDGLVDLQKGLKDGEQLATAPRNLMSGWAKQDPASAWAWLQLHQESPFADRREFFKGYRVVATSDEFGSFLAEAANAGIGYERPRLRTAWEIFADQPNSEELGAFLQKLQGDRLNNLRDLFEVANYGHGDHGAVFKEVLLKQMAADERMAVLPDFFRGRNFEEELRFYTPALRKLGHSDEEIQRMLSPTAGH